MLARWSTSCVADRFFPANAINFVFYSYLRSGTCPFFETAVLCDAARVAKSAASQ